ncbi:MAG: class I SAM-dependent DNA methyltransferase [Bacteroidota bacterium]
MIETVACDLVAYIVVNQILLYYLLRTPLNLPPFKTIENLADLRIYFKRITEIDYRAVYIIDVVEQLPRRCLTEVNKIILAFYQLKPESMKHDLLGRMFHEFLPFKTRKIFATFYTKPVAAEMLARLAVHGFPEKIIEPACGSGTLLVAAYQAIRREDPKLNHGQVLRKIYALDIMPFAAHLAALNLTLQDLEAHTEKVNVGIGNSLSLASEKPEMMTQGEMFDKVVSRRVDVNQQHEEEIQLPTNANVVIMNPPYTDRGRLTDQMLGKRIGAFKERQNYWAYFLRFANDVLSEGGSIAAVLPRLFLAGSTSKEVRKWIFNDLGYELLYIIRTTKEFAFSEAAAFRDFLVVLRKPSEENAERDQPCRIVYLNRSLDDISIDEAGEIADSIRFSHQGRNYIETSDFTSFSVPQKIIKERCENLWFTVGFEKPNNAAVVSRIWGKLFQVSGTRLVSLKTAIGANSPKLIAKLIPRGFEPKPKGLYSVIFAVRPLDEARYSANDMVITTDREHSVVCNFLNHIVEIPKEAFVPGIKTASYFRRFEISKEYCDLVIQERNKISTNLQRISDIRVNYAYIRESINATKTNLLVTRRLNVVAPGTTFLAFYSKNEAVSTKSFYSVRCSENQALSLCLWFNSIFGIIQFLDKRMETEGGYCEILKEDLIEYYVPNGKDLPQKLKEWYLKYNKEDFPPLYKQFEGNPNRRFLDRGMMIWMGWPESEVDSDLDELYEALNNEFQLLRSAMTG